ncbi:MAG TPA: phosphopantetheine-binding protein [Thermoanaerobaculia bacterium]|nr:phosphopantetheine-binding protein [Thermoanaerobaculia bacterium]
MDAVEITGRIKQIIANVAGLDAQRIDDGATFHDDLNLDSLSLLEIGVDVDLAFQLNLPDERYKEIGSIPEMAALILQRKGELTGVAVQG